jgi:hypothetical protein
VRDVEGGGLTLALGLKERGMDFGSPDEKLMKIIFLIVIPPQPFAAKGWVLFAAAGGVGEDVQRVGCAEGNVGVHDVSADVEGVDEADTRHNSVATNPHEFARIDSHTSRVRRDAAVVCGNR